MRELKVAMLEILEKEGIGRKVGGVEGVAKVIKKLNKVSG